ncbi:TPA: HNH endonuclease [Enterobacter hormaechei subsp. xiangfangensis]|nr:HNH endonuclease [Enterobacter hormaechei subsp. xiangfangensis]
MSANNIDSNGITSTERAILRELGVDKGSHFKVILKSIRQFLKLGYTYADAVYATSYSAGYISRQLTLTPKEKRHERRDNLMALQRAETNKLRVMYDSYYAIYTKKLADLRRAEERRQLHASRLQTFKKGSTRKIRYTAFGAIRVRNADADDWDDLALHIEYVTNRRDIEAMAKKSHERMAIRNALVEGGKRLTAREPVHDRDLPDDEAPLKELARRYIPGARFPAFQWHARTCGKMAPLAVVESFLGHKVGNRTEPEEEQPVTIPEALKPAKDIKDPVIVDGIEYRSTRAAMEALGIGEDKHAREFRLDVKANGVDYWTHEGKVYRFELKNLRPEHLAARAAREQELTDFEMKAGGRITETFQRDPEAQRIFRDFVRENFDGRCAVSGKRLGGKCQAAHIEPAAVDGCYNASNGVLLSPTLHVLYDAHLMGINPETLAVHFTDELAEDFPELVGVVITPLRYRLDTERLAERWAKFKGNKLPHNVIQFPA